MKPAIVRRCLAGSHGKMRAIEEQCVTTAPTLTRGGSHDPFGRPSREREIATLAKRIEVLGMDRLERVHRSLVGTLKTMGTTGDIDPFVEKFRIECLAIVSNRDTMNCNELSMKLLFIGALTATTVFFVFNEKEFGQGYSDFFFTIGGQSPPIPPRSE